MENLTVGAAAEWIRSVVLLILGNELLTDVVMKFVGLGACLGVRLTAAHLCRFVWDLTVSADASAFCSR